MLIIKRFASNVTSAVFKAVGFMDQRSKGRSVCLDCKIAIGVSFVVWKVNKRDGGSNVTSCMLSSFHAFEELSQ